MGIQAYRVVNNQVEDILVLGVFQVLAFAILVEVNIPYLAYQLHQALALALVVVAVV